MQNYKSVILLDKPARQWDVGLPVGNGRLGGMVMGKVRDETIVINEETLWYGRDKSRANRDAKDHIEHIRKMLLEGEVEEAAFIAKMAMTSTPKYNNPYQPAGDLRLSFKGHSSEVSNYKRILDIDNAIAHVAYTMNGVRYEREILASARYNVIAIKLTCSSKEGIALAVNIGRKPFEEKTGVISDDVVYNCGVNGPDGVKYFTAAKLLSDTKVNLLGDFAYTKGAREVIIYLTSATNFNIESGLKDECLKRLDAAKQVGYEKIKAQHINQYHQLYNHTELMLNDVKTPDITTDTMLREVKKGNEDYTDYLSLLLFNYGKYLMICSSYQCELPANLQGIWNGSFEPPWQSQFTININLQMNYWFVNKCGLGECNEALFNLVKRIREKGRETAKKVYGCRGFCAHHNTNLWASTDIEGVFDTSPFWVMGGAWLVLHMYEHYLYTGNEQFLKEEVLPIMEEAILFFEDYLYHSEDGKLMTGPSLSPENIYLSDKNQQGALCMSPTMDMMILRQLFTSYINGVKVVKSKKDISKVEKMLNGLISTLISEKGRILEWSKDYEEVEPGHRHISHLYGLHPGHEITKENKELYQAAKNTLIHRVSNGGGHTGWSRAWICCFWARLCKGEEFYNNLKSFLTHSVKDNMFATHPPFQIDGNFGMMEAILECIVQSHAGYIELLPALTSKWNKGSLKGVCLRGGMVLDISWENGNLLECEIISNKESRIVIKYREKEKTVFLKQGVKAKVELGL